MGVSTDPNIAAWVGRLGVVLMAAIIVWCVSTIQSLTLKVTRLDAHLGVVDSRPIPPPWVSNRLDDLRSGQANLRHRVERIEAKVGPMNNNHYNGKTTDEDADMHAWKAD